MEKQLIKQNQDVSVGEPIEMKEMTAIIWLLDGRAVNLKMQIPRITSYGDAYEAFKFYIESYILSMTRYFWSVVAYQISTPYNTWYPRVDIPTDKIYVANLNLGEWKNPDDITKPHQLPYNYNSLQQFFNL